MSGPELYERRRKKGWTQAYLASRMSIAVSTIQRWECGKYQISEKMAKLIRFTLS